MMVFLHRLVKEWSSYWFSISSPFPVSMVRIVVGILATLQFWFYLENGADWFGDRGWFNKDVGLYFLGNDVPGTGSQYRWSILINHPQWSSWIAVIGIVASIAMFVGIGSRLSPLLAWLALSQFHHRAPLLVSVHEPLLSALLFYLIIDPGRVAWTIKPVAIDGVPRLTANIALRSMQCHLWLWVAATVSHMLSIPAWWNGDAVGAAMHVGQGWIALQDRAHWSAQLATHMMIVLPLCFVLATIHPDSRQWARVPFYAWLFGLVAFFGVPMYALTLLAAELSFWTWEVTRVSRVCDITENNIDLSHENLRKPLARMRNDKSTTR